MTRRGGLAGSSEMVELDHTACDLSLVCDRTGLPIGKPTIAVALDRCTRMPHGIHIVVDPPSACTTPRDAGGAV